LVQVDSHALDRNINRIRRDIRVYARQMQSRIDADEDCSVEAMALMRAEADLRLYLERRESLA
jgi:hypothetical protein